MSYNNWINQNTNLSKRSRRGVWAFIFIFFFSVLANRLYTIYVAPSPLEVKLTQREKDFVEESDSLEYKRIEYRRRKSSYKKKEYNLPKNSFNPNSWKKKDWINLGLSSKQAQVIVNYKKSGFEFRIRKDVKKLFVINDALYKQLHPLIDLPDSIVYLNEDLDKKKKEFKSNILEINTLNLEELKSVRGIGDVLAKRILKFKESLGGFNKVAQLKEVYGLSQENYDLIIKQVKCNSNLVKQLNINTAAVDDLKVHPYFNWKLSNAIVKYRVQHGNYTTINELKNIVLIDDVIFDRIKPYVKIE